MSQQKTNLASFNNNWYKPGAGFVKRVLWFHVNAIFFSSIFPFSGFKIFLLRLFGAQIGKGVIVKPSVNIKYPWKLHVGNNVWIGEKVWIDNLALVSLGNHTCISQGAMLLTGNHNYKKSSFDLVVSDILIEEGAWIGAQSLVCPGVIIRSHAILSAGSIATTELEAYTIYQGNPAVKIRERVID